MSHHVFCLKCLKTCQAKSLREEQIKPKVQGRTVEKEKTV